MRESYEECVECERQRHGGLSPIYIYIYIYIYNKRSVTILSVLAVHRPFYISIYIYIYIHFSLLLFMYIHISPYSFLCRSCNSPCLVWQFRLVQRKVRGDFLQYRFLTMCVIKNVFINDDFCTETRSYVFFNPNKQTKGQ